MDDTRLDFKEAFIAQITDYLMVARLDDTTGVASSGGFYSVSDLIDFLNEMEVEDVLTSTNVDTALSANMGRVVNNKVETNSTNISANATDITDINNTFLLTDRTTGDIYKYTIYVDNGVLGVELVEQTTEE